MSGRVLGPTAWDSPKRVQSTSPFDILAIDKLGLPRNSDAYGTLKRVFDNNDRIYLSYNRRIGSIKIYGYGDVVYTRIVSLSLIQHLMYILETKQWNVALLDENTGMATYMSEMEKPSLLPDRNMAQSPLISCLGRGGTSISLPYCVPPHNFTTHVDEDSDEMEEVY